MVKNRHNLSRFSYVLLSTTALVFMGASTAIAGPEGGLTIGGSASIEAVGSNTTIRQSTDRAIIRWDSFDVQGHESVDFQQPSSSSITVNRIRDIKPSQIDGRITANGNIMLLNPNGVLFGAGSQVDVGGLVASTADIEDDEAFLAGGDVKLTKPGNVDAKIINRGRIKTAPGGLAGFVAPQIENHGIISATLGKVKMASGDMATIDFAGDGLIQIAVSDDVQKQIVKNSGTLDAQGGTVIMTAAAARGLIENLIVNDGTIKANTLGDVKGSISIRGSGVQIQNTGLIEANSNSAEEAGNIEIDGGFVSLGGQVTADGRNGGDISVTAGTLSLAGVISASGISGTGGQINIRAQDTLETSTSVIKADGLDAGGVISHFAENTLISSGVYTTNSSAGIGGNIDVSAWSAKFLSASLSANGARGGGTIRLGGEYQGGKNLPEDEIPNANYLIMDRGTRIRAEADKEDGDGGTVILWSEVETMALGSIYARPGTQTGQGGFVEISSGETPKFDADVQTGRGSRSGTILLDPKNILISDFSFNATSIIMGYGFQGGRTNTNTNLDVGDNFGFAVSLDNQRMAVGAPLDDGFENSASNTGAVYLFSYSDDSFSGAALESVIGHGYTGGKNIDVTLDNSDFFGRSVSLDSNNLAVGALLDDGSANSMGDSGAVYLFSFDDSSFTGGTLEATIGRNYTGGKNYDLSALGGSDYFGQSVALDGTRLAVGAYLGDGSGNIEGNSGEVYLFSFADTDFNGITLAATIGEGYAGGNNISVDLDNSDYFGYALALDDTSLIVGALLDDGQGNTVTNAGAAYLFSFANTDFNGGILQGVMGAGYTGGKNVNITNLEANDWFSSGVAIDGDSFVIGAQFDDGYLNTYTNSGSVYTFTRDNATFDTITPQSLIGYQYTGGQNLDTSGLGAGGSHYLGASVALDGMQLAVGEYNDGGGLNNLGGSGSVWGFTFSDTVFSAPNLEGTTGANYIQGRNFNVPQLQDNDNGIGLSVALDGRMLAIGNPFDDGANNSRAQSGAVYLYTFDDMDFTNGSLSAIIGDGYVGGNNYSQQLKIADYFGYSLSLDNNHLAVGVPLDDGFAENNGNSGAIFIYGFDNESFENITLESQIGYGYTGGRNVDIAALGGSDYLGYSVALDGARLAAGAIYDDGDGNSLTNGGAVHLITFDNTDLDNGVAAGIIGHNYTGGKNINQTGLGTIDQFGWSLALDGNRLAVGAIRDDGNGNTLSDSGAVYLYTFDDAAFTNGALVGKIGNGYTGAQDINFSLNAGDYFGSALALSGNDLFVGSMYDDGFPNNVGNAGAVFRFNFSDAAFSGGTLAGTIGARYLGADDYDLDGLLAGSDYFGSSLAIDGRNLVVGAQTDDGFGNNTVDSGAIYFFQYDDLTYSDVTFKGIAGAGYERSVLDSSVFVSNVGNSDIFGTSVSLDGNRLVVGAPYDDGFGNTGVNKGAAYLFSFSDAAFDGGVLESIIGDGYTGGKNINLALDNSDYFGRTVSLDGNRLAVGAERDDGHMNACGDCGAVYLFDFSNAAFSGGTLQSKIGSGYAGAKDVNVALNSSDYFGWSASLDGNNLAIGAQRDDGFGNVRTDSGAVYLYSFSDAAFSGGTLQAMIGQNYAGGKNINTALNNSDYFGNGVALDGTMLAVGAIRDDGFGNTLGDSGAVYLYSFDDTDFSGGTLEGIIGAGYTGGKNINVTTLEANDWFGSSVSLDNNRLAVGIEQDSGLNNRYFRSGAAQLYSFNDDSFSGGALQATIGAGYNAAKDIDMRPDFIADAYDSWSAVSLDGNRLVMGAPLDDGTGSAGNGGNVALMTFSDAAFNGGAITGLVGSGYATSANNITTSTSFYGQQDNFGSSVSLNSNRLAVGVQFDDGFNDSLRNSGAVYLYSIPGGDYDSILFEGIIGNGYTGGKNVDMSGLMDQDDYFGNSVSLDGSRLAVGSIFDDGASNENGNAGAVYLFSFDDLAFTNGTLQSTIGHNYTGGKNVNVTLGGSDYFGSSVSLDGNRLAVGARLDDGLLNNLGNAGAVYLFSFDDALFTSGELESRIGYGYNGAKDFDLTTLDNSDYFSWSVSLDGNRLAVGAPFDNGALNDQVDTGAVHLFTFDDPVFTNPALQSTLGYGYGGANDLDVTTLFTNDYFGASVALDGTVLAVGATSDDGLNFDTTGANGAIFLYTFADLDLNDPVYDSAIGYNYTGGKNINIALSALGSSVSLDSGVLVAGQPNLSDVTGQAGAMGRVYIWRDSLSPIGTGANFGTLAGNTIGITSASIAGLLSTPQDVILQASNDITIASPIFVNNGSGAGGTLTLQAGRSVFVNAAIATDDGDLNIFANENLTTGVVNSQRDTGAATINMGTGGSVDAGAGSVVFRIDSGDGKTNTQAGDFVLGNITAADFQALSGSQTGDIILNGVITASAAGDAIILDSGANFTNNYGAGALDAANGRWLIYSDHDDYTVLNGLSPVFTDYNCEYTGGCAVVIPGGLDSLLYEYNIHLVSVSVDTERQYGDANPDLATLQSLFVLSGFENGDDVLDLNILPTATIATTASATANAGTTHAITLAGGSDDYYDYYFLDGFLTINKKDVTASYNGTLSKIYGEANPLPTTYDFTYVGLANGQNNSQIAASADYGTIDLTTGAGDYTVGALFTSTNYNVTNAPTTTLSINKRDITAAWNGTLSRTYGDANPIVDTNNFTYTGLVNGDLNAAVTGEADYLGTTAATDVGSYNVNGVFSSANYTVTNTPVTTLDIIKRDITANVNAQSRQYGDTDPILDHTNVTWNNLANLENGSVLDAFGFDFTTSLDTSNAGTTHDIDITGFNDNNYNLTSFTNGTLTINKRDITATVNNDSRGYGDANPVWDWNDVIWNNLANLETGAVLDTLTVSAATALATSNAATTHNINVSGFSDDNYNLTGFAAGTLTINKRDITANVGNTSRHYGYAGTNATWSDVVWTNMANAETGAVLDSITFDAPTANLLSAAGTNHVLDISAFSDNNYNLTGSVAGQLDITQAPLTVNINSFKRQQSLPNPAFTYSLDGLRNSDPDTVLSGVTLSSLATDSSPAGLYAITGAGGIALNYFVDSFVDGTLTILAAPQINQIPATVEQTIARGSDNQGNQNTSFVSDNNSFSSGAGAETQDSYIGMIVIPDKDSLPKTQRGEKLLIAITKSLKDFFGING